MPHRCLECKNTVDSSLIDLKQGCPVCGCKKFQYVRPKKETKPASPTVAEYVAGVEKVAKAEYEASRTTREKLDKVPEPSVEPAPSGEKSVQPTARARQEGDRIESVRIVEPGTYDINLPVLLSRRELVMSKEEGTYYVDLPSALKPPKKGWRRKK